MITRSGLQLPGVRAADPRGDVRLGVWSVWFFGFDCGLRGLLRASHLSRESVSAQSRGPTPCTITLFSCTQNARTTATAEPALPKRVPAVLGPPLAAATSQVSAERCEAVVLRGPPPRRVPALLPLPLLLPLLLLLLRVALGLGLPKICLSLSVCLPGLLVRRGLAWRAPQLEVDIVPGLVSRVSK